MRKHLSEEALISLIIAVFLASELYASDNQFTQYAINAKTNPASALTEMSNFTAFVPADFKTYKVPDEFTPFFTEDFESGKMDTNKWNITDRQPYNAGLAPLITNISTLGRFSANLTALRYAPNIWSFPPNYGDNPWVQINKTEVWTQQWVYVPEFLSSKETSFSCLTNDIKYDDAILALYLHDDGSCYVLFNCYGSRNEYETGAFFPTANWIQITTHAKISEMDETNGSYQIWVGADLIFNLTNVDNSHGCTNRDFSGKRNIIGSYEVYTSNQYAPSSMSLLYDNVTLFEPAPFKVSIGNIENSTYTTPTVPIEISASGKGTDKVWFNFFNGSNWVLPKNKSYTSPTKLVGVADGTYILYAWANNTELPEEAVDTVTIKVALSAAPSLAPTNISKAFITTAYFGVISAATCISAIYLKVRFRRSRKPD
jgi:hypothetical protein